MQTSKITTIHYEWWQSNGMGEPKPEHVQALKERAEDEIIPEQMAQGMVEGELTDNVRMAGEPEEGTDYRGYWRVTVSSDSSKPQSFELPYGITVDTNGDGGVSMSSSLVDQFKLDDLPPGPRAEASADAVESLLQALAGAGVDLNSPQIHEALTTAVEAIAGNLPDDDADSSPEYQARVFIVSDEDMIVLDEMYVSTAAIDVWPAGVNFVREGDHLEPDGEHQMLPSMSIPEFVQYREYLKPVELPNGGPLNK